MALHLRGGAGRYRTDAVAPDGSECAPGDDRTGTDRFLTMRRARLHWLRTMSRTMRRSILSVAACMAVCWSPPLLPQEPDPQAEQQLQAVNTALARIENWLEDTRRQQSREESQLSELQNEIAALVQQHSDNLQQMDALQQSLAALDERQQELLDDTEAQRAQIAQALQVAYLHGSDSRLKMLLNQQDPDVARRMMVYFNTLNASHLAQIRQWQRTIDELEANRNDAEQTRQELNSANRHLQEQQQAMLSIRQQREDVIADLQRQMTERRGEREELLQDRADLQALIDEINRIIVDIPAPEDLRS